MVCIFHEWGQEEIFDWYRTFDGSIFVIYQKKCEKCGQIKYRYREIRNKEEKIRFLTNWR